MVSVPSQARLLAQEKKAREAKRREDAFKTRGQAGAAERFRASQKQEQVVALQERVAQEQSTVSSLLTGNIKRAVRTSADPAIFRAAIAELPKQTQQQEQVILDRIAREELRRKSELARLEKERDRSLRDPDIPVLSRQVLIDVGRGFQDRIRNLRENLRRVRRVSSDRRQALQDGLRFSNIAAATPGLSAGDVREQELRAVARERATAAREKRLASQPTLTQQEFRQAQRDAFVLSGKSQATPEQVAQAQARVLSSPNVTLTDSVTGRPIGVSPDKTFAFSVQTPKPKESSAGMVGFDASGASVRISPLSGRAVLVQEGTGVTTASELFERLDAPVSQQIGRLDVVRPDQRLSDKARKLLGVSTPERPDIKKGSINVFEQQITIPTEEAARFAGFPGTGTFRVLTDDRGVTNVTDAPSSVQRFFPEVVPVIEKTTPFVSSIGRILSSPDRAAVRASEAPLGSVDPVTGMNFNPSSQLLIRGVRGLGRELQNPTAEFGTPILRERQAAERQMLADRGIKPSAAKEFEQAFVGRIGERIEEKPVSGGLIEPFLLGSGLRLAFGGVKTGFSGVRRFFPAIPQVSARAGVVGRNALVTSVVGSAGIQVATSPTPGGALADVVLDFGAVGRGFSSTSEVLRRQSISRLSSNVRGQTLNVPSAVKLEEEAARLGAGVLVVPSSAGLVRPSSTFFFQGKGLGTFVQAFERASAGGVRVVSVSPRPLARRSLSDNLLAADKSVSRLLNRTFREGFLRTGKRLVTPVGKAVFEGFRTSSLGRVTTRFAPSKEGLSVLLSSRAGRIGGRRARDRAKRARPLDAGRRAAQSLAQRQPKFKVTEFVQPGVGRLQVRELRGQARDRLKEPRVIQETEIVKKFRRVDVKLAIAPQAEVLAIVGGGSKTFRSGIFVDRLVLPPGIKDIVPPAAGRIRAPKGTQRPKTKARQNKVDPAIQQQFTKLASYVPRPSTPTPTRQGMVVQQQPLAKQVSSKIVSNVAPAPRLSEVGGLRLRPQKTKLVVVDDAVQTAPPSWVEFRGQPIRRGSSEDRRLRALERVRARVVVERDSFLRPTTEFFGRLGERSSVTLPSLLPAIPRLQPLVSRDSRLGVFPRLSQKDSLVNDLARDSAVRLDSLPVVASDVAQTPAVAQDVFVDVATDNLLSSDNILSRSPRTVSTSVLTTPKLDSPTPPLVPRTPPRRPSPRLTPPLVPRTPPRRPPPTRLPPPKIPLPPRPTLPQRRTPSPESFVTQVRRQGVFRDVSRAPLPFDQAVQKGFSQVSATAAASFRIVDRSTGQVVKDDRFGKALAGLPKTLRPAKFEKGVFVERRRFRISSPGEKAEIRPKKGVLGLSRMKGLFGG